MQALMSWSAILVNRGTAQTTSNRLAKLSQHQQPTLHQQPSRVHVPISRSSTCGMSTCAAAVAAIGGQLLLQQPALAHSLAPPGTPSIEQNVATQQPGRISWRHNFRQLTAPNLTTTLSEEDVNTSQKPDSSASEVPSSQPSTPPQQDTQSAPSTSSSSPETNPSAAPPASPLSPPAAEDPQKTEEEQRKSFRKTRRSRIKELEETRLELAEKQLKLIDREKELLDKDQTVSTLREELDLERKLRALLTKEKDKAEEEAALAMGLCTGAFTLP